MLLNDEPWLQDALCAQVDPELFFAPKGGAKETRAAKKICLSCPVMEECLSFALEHNEAFGVWGGKSERERRRLRKGLAPEPEPVRHLAPCGTVAAFQRHVRAGEAPCEACREAKNRESREWNAVNADVLRARRAERRGRSLSA